MARLDIGIKKDAKFTIIVPVGRIDVQHMLVLRNFFKSIEEKALTKVAVDMFGVTFIDSYGVSILTNFVNQLKLHDGWMVLFNCKKEISDILKIAGVDQIMPILGSMKEVREQFAE